MSTKSKVKIITDAAMIIVLLLLMGHMLTGKEVHKIIGLIMFCLWIVHNVLNLRWYTSFFKGRYTLRRIIDTTVNIFMLLLFAALIISSIIVSGLAYRVTGSEAGMSFARKLHMASVYWCFIFSSFHLGLHWNRIKRIISNALNIKTLKIRTVFLHAIVLFLSGFGVYAFIKHQLFSYMFLRILFVFFNFEQPVYSFYFDYISMMVLFASLSYYASGIISKEISLRRLVWWYPEQEKIK